MGQHMLRYGSAHGSGCSIGEYKALRDTLKALHDTLKGLPDTLKGLRDTLKAFRDTLKAFRDTFLIFSSHLCLLPYPFCTRLKNIIAN